jgi:dihydrofolate reductase
VLISIVAAVDLDGVIGRDNGLPWRLPADLRRFRSITLGKPVIMGRRTFESIGRPLGGRTNIVLTRHDAPLPEGVLRADGVEHALDLAGPAEEICVIGGATVFAEFLPRTDRMYLTTVLAHVGGDTFFPAYDATDWTETSHGAHEADARNPLPYAFRVLDRVRSSSRCDRTPRG